VGFDALFTAEMTPHRKIALVMPGLVPGIHVLLLRHAQTWMAGTSPAMTLVLGDSPAASRLTIRKFPAARLSIQNHGVDCLDRGDQPLSAAAAGYVQTMGSSWAG
jgi:hypothetical protein